MASYQYKMYYFLFIGQKQIYLPGDSTDTVEPVVNKAPLPAEVKFPSSVIHVGNLPVEPETPLPLAIEKKPSMEDVKTAVIQGKKLIEGVHLIDEAEETDGSTVDTIDLHSDGSSQSDQLETSDGSSDVNVLEEVQALRSKLRSFCDEEDDIVPELNEKG